MRDGAILKLAAVAGVVGFAWTFVMRPPPPRASETRGSSLGIRGSAVDMAAVEERARAFLAENPTSLRGWQQLADALAFQEDPFEAARAWLEEAPRELAEEGGAGLLWYWLGRQYGSEEEGFRPPEYEDRAKEMWRISAEAFASYVLEHPDEAAPVHWRLFGYALKRIGDVEAAAGIFLRTREELLGRMREGEMDAGEALSWCALVLRDAASAKRTPAVFEAYREQFAALDEAASGGIVSLSGLAERWQQLFQDLAELEADELAATALERLEAIERARLEGAGPEAEAYARRSEAWEVLAGYWGLLERSDRAQAAWREAAALMEWAVERRPRAVWLYDLARQRAWVGDRDGAIEALEQAVSFGWNRRRATEREPAFERLKGDGRFNALVEGMAPQTERLEIR